ncbi:hemerythrin domain-containing protein [Microbispora sp. RL4-1S]|uniref:Hemerythrin domain-containing protein n=1 Tax=Microbispora oryzae TaxID=2806554 RepID=A0A940WD00_9ACTN|nr:hemerythrin domain-containing protein [Microbispora oryzae]MBP2703220.1 hemerythrin domain-containing protein [Microbispora oryzae]
MSDRLDMTAMYAAHDALRRELEHLARTTARVDDDPRRILGAAVGWELFKKSLHVHHTAEDDALWPAMREAVAGRPDDLALLAAMESEHEAIDPLIDAIDAEIDAALRGRESGPERIGDLTDALATGLSGHLKHEEDEALPLIQATVTEPQWQHFGQVNARLVGPDAPRILPWMLDGASERTIAVMLAPLPEPARLAYRNEWQPAYAALDLWGTGSAGGAG